MKKNRDKIPLRVKYSNKSIEARVIRDFLPSPGSLNLKVKRRSDIKIYE